MKLIIFQAIFHPCYDSCISIKKVYRYFKSQSNTTIDSLSSHYYTIELLKYAIEILITFM